MRCIYPLAILLISRNIWATPTHRHRHSSARKSSNNGIIIPDELGQLLPVEDTRFGEYEIVEHEDYNELKVVRRCTKKLCGPGRKCVNTDAGGEQCVCAEASSCPAGHKLVCGSDGNFYDTHCDLHRTACVLRKRIFVDKTGEACFQKDLLEAEISESLPVEQHVKSIKKDLSMSPNITPSHPRPLSSVERSVSATKPARLPSAVKCSSEQFEELKHLLKIYHCNRLGIASCDNQDEEGRRSLITQMYSYYDRDSDGLISVDELSYSQAADHLEKLAHVCSLLDILVYSPVSQNVAADSVDLNTFYREFGLGVDDSAHDTVVQFNNDIKVTYVTADGYNSVELNCGLPDVATVTWQRNAVSIDFQDTDGISILYITAVSLEHTGNYTCRDTVNTGISESQLLIVQAKPVIRTNVVGKVMEGVTTALKCHANGVPEPTVQWQVAQYALPSDKSRYNWHNGNSTLSIRHPHVGLDSEKYQCVAKSASGWALSSTEVTVLSEEFYHQVAGLPSRGLYLIFHASGYTAYEAEHCYTTHSIEAHASDFTHTLQEDEKDTLKRLCPLDEPCAWGDVVNVLDRYIYVSQPSLNRVVVIDVKDNFRAKYVVILKYRVSSIQYMPNTDELWLLVGNQPQFLSVMILADASKSIRQNPRPLLPQQTVFDSVEKLFLPPLTSLNTTARYAYTLHYQQSSLSRLDITTVMYRGALQLSNHDCQPLDFHHLSIGGLALLECGEDNPHNLVVDTVSNQVIGRFVAGSIHVAPNGRHIVSTIKPNKLSVHYLHDNGTIGFLYNNHTTQVSIAEVLFMESKKSRGYDLAITSPDEHSVLFMDLITKETQVIEGFLSGRTNTIPSWSLSKLTAGSAAFGDTVLVPSRGAAFVINKQYNMIACQWNHIESHQLTVWVEA